MILATDGMWNHLRRRDISQVVSQVDKTKQDEQDTVHVVRHLLETTLDKICKKEGVTRNFLSDVEPGFKKR